MLKHVIPQPLNRNRLLKIVTHFTTSTITVSIQKTKQLELSSGEMGGRGLQKKNFASDHPQRYRQLYATEPSEFQRKKNHNH